MTQTQGTLLGLSGSLRTKSTNTALVREAARIFNPDTFYMADINWPLYNGDIEETTGVPHDIAQLVQNIQNADAVVISTPEYNKNISGVLKNALDWMSRVPDAAPWHNKPVAILSATAGRSGGERAQCSLRQCLQPFNPRILQGPEVTIASNYTAFNEDGTLKDEKSIEILTNLMNDLRALI